MINFNKLGIKARVLLLALLPIFLITLLLTGYSIAKSVSILNESLRDQGKIMASQLAPASEYGVLSGNNPYLQKLIQQALSNEADIASILIVDEKGKQLAISGKLVAEIQEKSALNSVGNQVSIKGYVISSAPILRSFVEIDDYNDTSFLESNAAKKAPTVIGQIYITISTQRIDAIKKSLIWKSILLGFVGFLISGLLAYRFGNSIVKPIIGLANSIQTLGTGQLNLRVDEDAAGEIKVLQLGFNNMATHIQQSHDLLQDRIQDATRMLRHQAQHDSLTGLTNRQEFERKLAIALDSVKKTNAKHIFCYMDLDQFKVVNDTCGHHAGDELLRQISLILSQRVREEDTFARLGGDEFGLLLENCDLPNALMIAEEMRVMIQDFRFVHENRMFKIGVSIGMVEITREMEDLGAITSCADAACYAAKDNGRNRIHLFRHQDNDLAKRHVEMEWVGRINLAMEEERFCLYCQAILPLQPNDETTFYEILIRKIGEDGTIILPMAFIPAAERYHLMAELDRWVIKKTFSVYQELFDSQHFNSSHLLSINLSGMSLSDKGLLDYIKEQFEIYHVPPTRICFEITETSAIINLTNTVNLMQSLKLIGCKFLLDDFGSGMSSFAYLKNLPVDYLKMDGGFVRDISRNPIDLAMAKSIQSIAKAMQIKTIAEFVECQKTLDLLREMGVDYGQGFYLGTPMPIESTISNFRQLSLIE
jgi:diguanylate cyclase (GGDEF)-like protein